MTFSDDPVWLDGPTYSGAEARRAEAMSFMTNGAAGGALGGVRPGDPGLLVSLSGMTISVASGVAAIPYPGQGVYRAYNATTWTGTVNTADASLTRIDLVYLRVWDNAVDAAGLAKADVVYLAGTPGSGVAPTPAAPQVYISLASINVPAGSTTPTVTDLRPMAVAPGGIALGGSVGGYYTGQYRDSQLAAGGLERYNGTAWVPYAQVLTARKSADQSVTGTIALQTDSQLTVNVVPGTAYAFEAMIIYSTSAVADFQMAWSIPALSSISWSPWALSGDPTTDTGSIRVANSTATASPLTVTTGTPSTTNLVARPVGTLLTTTIGGAFTFRWGQANSDSATTTVHVHSWLRVTRLAS